eukprot:11709145-Alexandrium_andersonii.AAC.1
MRTSARRAAALRPPAIARNPPRPSEDAPQKARTGNASRATPQPYQPGGGAPVATRPLPRHAIQEPSAM